VLYVELVASIPIRLFFISFCMMVFDSESAKNSIPFAQLVIIVFFMVVFLALIAIPCAITDLLLRVICRFSIEQLSALMLSMGLDLLDRWG